MAVFNSLEFQRFAGVSQDSVSKYIMRMKDKGLLIGVEKGKVSITEDPFIVASQIAYPSYISFTTGLYLNNLMEQTVDKIFVATPVRRNKLAFNGMDIIFVHFNPSMMFGYQKHRKENSYIVFGEPEKIILDMLYKPWIADLSYILDIVKQIDVKKLLDFASSIKEESVKRRLFYLLDYSGISVDADDFTVVYTLNPHNKFRGKYVSKWKIYDNEVNF